MEILGIILSIIAFLLSLGAFGYFIKTAYIDGEDDIDWYKDHFKIIAGAMLIAFIAAGLGLSVGTGLARILSIVTIVIMFIYFITYLVQSRNVQR